MLKYCLTMSQVVLPDPRGLWPAPLDLNLELNEILLIEKAGADESAPLLEVAASLLRPAAGQVLQWGSECFSLAREERYYLRRRIAYLAPGQVLLSRLTLGQNIALSPCYYSGLSSRAVLAEHADLLEQLSLQPYLAQLPRQVEKDVYLRALWARELIRQPDLILVALDKAWETLLAPSQAILFLQDYLAAQGSAALLTGESLQSFYPLASRLLRLEAGRLIPQPLSEHQGRPLTDFLPLVAGEE